MPKIEFSEEAKSMMLFSGAGIAIGGVSSILGGALFAVPVGIAALLGIKRGVEKLFSKDRSWVMANGLMPYLTFWYMIWVIAINV